MPTLVQGLSGFFGRVELFALGLDGARRAALAALERGRPLEAREQAKLILAEAPESLVGLALWADAAEAAWLDHEVVSALSRLVELAPYRADAWLRLGLAGERIAWEGAREALLRAASSADASAAREAAFRLADLDLAEGDLSRAQRWVELAPSQGALGSEPRPDKERALRLAELALLRDDLGAAAAHVASLVPEDVTSTREVLVRARVALARGEHEQALVQAMRAFVLDAPGGRALLATLVGERRSSELSDEVRPLVEAAGLAATPLWEAAFALAEGKTDEARLALGDAVREGDAVAARSLARLALATHDARALSLVAERAPAALTPTGAALLAAERALSAGDPRAALDALDAPLEPLGADWVGSVRRRSARALAKADAGPSALFDELFSLARASERHELAPRIEALAVEAERPLRLAVVGEFNAGKSTFLNALLGEDVAPTGILPTTATLHWVAWAPDRVARVVLHGEPDRVVPHERLKPTLRELEARGARVERVLLYAPLERLRQVEVLDTPGFNAPDREHAARARQAFEEAHVALWLLDATGPLRESERRVLAEIAGLGVPMLVLLNKRDRVPEGSLAAIVRHVEEGLAAAGLAPLCAPLALSARDALRAGALPSEPERASALAASGWLLVEEALTRHVVDRSEALRRAAIARKASLVAASIAERAEAREREQARLDDERAREARALGDAISRVKSERDALAVTIERALEPRRHALAKDLAPVLHMDEARARDPSVRAFVAQRFVAHLAPEVALEGARALGVPVLPELARAVELVLAGAASTLSSAHAALEARLAPTIAAALDALLAAAHARASSEPSAPRGGFVARRARGLAEGLAVPGEPEPPTSRTLERGGADDG
jgi:GTP-binding protein EngB required for normal cell division